MKENSEISQSEWLSSIPQQADAMGYSTPVHISSGATSDIYRHKEDGRIFISKRLKAEHMGKESYHLVFRKEYEVGCKINSKYFPRYYELSAEATVIYMEYINGITLRDAIKRDPSYFRSFSNLRRLITQIVEAVGILHSHQVIHLDLKPENIMLTMVNKDVRILDLGYCYTDTTPFTMGCTSRYAAPEQFNAKCHVDARTDIYAIGKILTFILNETSIKSKYPAILSPLSIFRRIARRCTKNNPDARYQKVEDILRDLNSAIRRNIYSIISTLIIVAVAAVLLFFYAHSVDYDVKVKSHTTTLHLKFINDGKELEIVPFFDWGNSYSDNISIPNECEVDGRRVPITKIGDIAFFNSPNLTSVNIPQSIKVIGHHAFLHCPELTILTLPDSLQVMDYAAFSACSKLENIVLPSTLKELSNSCFTFCSFKEIIIPEGVTVLRMDALASNHNLKKVSLPSTLKTIERGVFWDCTSLERIDIPASVTFLGDFLLWGCTNLKTVYNHAVVPQSCSGIVDKGFKGIIYVPAQSVEAYRHTKGWEKLNIQPMPEEK